MAENNMRNFLICLDLCAFCVILLSDRSCGADYRYEACLPKNCGHGPNISFPFYIPGRQQSYCGFPKFGLIHCSRDGFPLLQLPEDKYVVKDIFYRNRSLRVSDAAASSPNGSNGCFPRFRNTSLRTDLFSLADNVTQLHLFSNCTASFSGELSGHRVACGAKDRQEYVLPLYDKDKNFLNAVKNCKSNISTPVEKMTDDGDMGMEDLEQLLRRGFVLNWTSSDCDECESSGGRCGFNVTTYHFKCFCPDRPHSRSCKPEKGQSKVILVAAVSGGGVFLILSLLISFTIWKHKGRIKRAYFLSRKLSKPDIEAGSTYFGTPIFSYHELEGATSNFDSSKELGDGGFGTVYYGKLQDGREVAIKRLFEHNCRRLEQYMNEIKILTCLRHRNLVSLYGCTSRRSKELLLVYEFIPNGTVADHLHGERAKEAPLAWPVRMKIAIETAGALSYLHKSDIIHRDVKTDNILLDHNFCVKIADFGLSRVFPNDVTHISTAPQGTPGYVDPEYHQCYQLTDKSDVYSFGVVLVELISSMPAVDISRHRHEINLANLAVNKIQTRAFDELIDPFLGYKSDAKVTRMTMSVAELAFQCLQLDKDKRPSMDEVLEFLEEIQGGEESTSEKMKDANDSSSGIGKVPPSPETDDVVLLKNKNFQSSPNSVTDVWLSNPTTRSSVG